MSTEKKQDLTQIKVKEFGPVGTPANGVPFAVVKSLQTQTAPGVALALKVQKSAEGSVLFPDLLARQKLNDVWWEHRDALGSLYWNAIDQIADPTELKQVLQKGVADFATAMITAFEQAIPSGTTAAMPSPADQAKALVEQAVAKVGAKMTKQRKDALQAAYDLIGQILSEVTTAETTEATPAPAAKAEEPVAAAPTAEGTQEVSKSVPAPALAEEAKTLDITKQLADTQAELAKVQETVKALSKLAAPSQQTPGAEGQETTVNKSGNPWAGFLKRP